MNDRDRAKLRGLVKSVVEEHTTTEYDPAGNLLSWRTKDPTGREYGDTYSYDDHGRVRWILSRRWDGSTAEKVYSYDESGRPLGIVDSDGERTTFEFDKQGHKTETRRVKKTGRQPEAAAIGMDLVLADIDGTATLDFRFRQAGSFKTIYNDQHQPTETQAYAGDGHLLGRVVRTFDDKGRITGVNEIIDDPMSQFPAKALKEMIAEAPIPLDELRAALAKSFNSLQAESGKTYSYDSDGRIEKAVLNTGMLGTFARFYTYNDHGDVIEEHTVLARNSAIPIGVPFHTDEKGELIPDKPPSEWPPQPDFPTPPDTHYSYIYDSHGNWTETTITYSTESSVTVRRELTYY